MDFTPKATERAKLVVRAQAVYYGASGAWAILHRPSFEAVSGSKTDYWLVRTVGALTAATAGALALGARSDHLSDETYALALSTAGAFATIDACYAARGTISRVYWLDFIVQASIISQLVTRLRRPPRPAGSPCPAKPPDG
jgi:hypothetical protein